MLCRNIGIIQNGQLIEDTSMKSLLAKLQFETIILDIESSGRVPVIKGYNSELMNEGSLSVEVARDQGINEVFNQLSEQGVKVLSMRNKSNRLEELFLKLTEETRVVEDAHV